MAAAASIIYGVKLVLQSVVLYSGTAVPFFLADHHPCSVYQLAFFTPGRLPETACILNMYWGCVLACLHLPGTKIEVRSYPGELEVTEDTPGLASHCAPVPDLCRLCVGVHLGELQLCFGADAGREGCVSDEVAEGLPAEEQLVQCCQEEEEWFIRACQPCREEHMLGRWPTLPSSR